MAQPNNESIIKMNEKDLKKNNRKILDRLSLLRSEKSWSHANFVSPCLAVFASAAAIIVLDFIMARQAELLLSKIR